MCMLGSKTLLFSYNMHLFLLGMHIISATVSVSINTNFSVIGNGPIRKFGRYL